MTIVVVPGASPAADTASLDPKDPRDSIWVYFDFTAWLPNGVSVVSAVTKCTDVNLDDVTAQIVSGPASILNFVRAQQFITGGLLGSTYLLSCEATFSDGQTETLSINLPIAYTFGTPS